MTEYLEETMFCPRCGHKMVMTGTIKGDNTVAEQKCPSCGYQCAGIFPVGHPEMADMKKKVLQFHK